jgi:hypothetical protein
MTIERLIVKEFVVEEGTKHLEVGERFSYFVDEYDTVYRPRDGFTVTGENLMDHFVEVERQEDE